VGKIPFTELAKKVYIQKESLEIAGEMGEQVRNKLTGQNLSFFEVNLIGQQKILLGITSWLEALVMAVDAENDNNREYTIQYLESALDAFELINEGKELVSKGQKWNHWYRGDTKMNLPEMERITIEVLNQFY